MSPLPSGGDRGFGNARLQCEVRRYYPNRYVSGHCNVKILIALADRHAGVRAEELVAEDLGQEDVIGLVLGFEAVAADGAIGAAQLTWFPGLQLRAGGANY